MEKLSVQDAGFLKIESAHCPFHVAGLMILKKPDNARANYLRKLAVKCGRLNELWPVCNKQLNNPENLSEATWVEAKNYDPAQHVFHYSLPEGGNMDGLMQLVTRAHERHLDRGRPLWEIHLIEGLPRGRFALYCKLHHALVDGVGAMNMMQSLLSTSPAVKLKIAEQETERRHHENHSLFQRINDVREGVLKQYKAIPELSRLLAHMGENVLKGKQESMRLPFTAPRTLFNTELDSKRCIVLCDLPLNQVRRMSRHVGGSVNDVLLAVCGGALRDYLLEQKELPRASLVAGVPVSLKSEGAGEGNKLSYMLCPFFTDEPDPLKRLHRVIKVTKNAKKELAGVSITAAEDFYALLIGPAILLAATGNLMKVRPAMNVTFSNVPGAREKMYLEGAELEAVYPLSVVTDTMGLNITVLSHGNKLCFAIASCPKDQPDIESLGCRLKASYTELREAIG